MKRLGWRTLATRLPLVVAAAAAPVAFPLSQMGIGSLHQLGLELIVPAALTVLTAHAAFGVALAGLLELRIPLAPFPAAVRNAPP